VETEVLEGETRQILTANRALMEAAYLSLEAVQAAITLGQAPAPVGAPRQAFRLARMATTAAMTLSGL